MTQKTELILYNSILVAVTVLGLALTIHPISTWF